MSRMATVFGSTYDVAGASQCRAVSPSDADALPLGVAKGLYVCDTGDVSVICEHDTDPVVFTVGTAGTRLPVRAKQVKATGTTATTIIALY